MTFNSTHNQHSTQNPLAPLRKIVNASLTSQLKFSLVTQVWSWQLTNDDNFVKQNFPKATSKGDSWLNNTEVVESARTRNLDILVKQQVLLFLLVICLKPLRVRSL